MVEGKESDHSSKLLLLIRRRNRLRKGVQEAERFLLKPRKDLRKDVPFFTSCDSHKFPGSDSE